MMPYYLTPAPPMLNTERMDVERTIDEIQQMREMFEAPWASTLTAGIISSTAMPTTG
jgi:hypothetical protein